MGFDAGNSLSEGCGQADVITDFGGNVAGLDDMHTFRIAQHPAAAVHDSLQKKHSGVPAALETAPGDTVSQELGQSSLEGSANCTSSNSNARRQAKSIHNPTHDSSLINLQRDGAPERMSTDTRRCPSTILISPDQGRPGSPALSMTSTQSSNYTAADVSVTRAQRTRFLVFMKILFKVLEQANDYELRNQAKSIVAECTRRNRLGDPGFVPLIGAVDKRLRRLVGESRWKRASILLRHFAAKQHSNGGKSIPRDLASDSV